MDGSGRELIPLSALQHYAYCPRQCALIHVEQTYDENLYTMRGNRVHEHVDEPGSELTAEGRIERSLPLQSKTLGLVGRADVVVFPEDGPPYPVEYKAGRRKHRLADDVQLCAQALCLEEMLDVQIEVAFIYHARSKRRRRVAVDSELRATTEEISREVHAQLSEQTVPPPVADERCDKCSLVESCMPFAIRRLQREDDPCPTSS